VVGDSARMLYRQYAESGLDPRRVPIASLSMAEEEIRLVGSSLCAGHITAATYFNSLDNESNRHFTELWHNRYGDRPTSTWSESAYNQVHLFARALERTGSLDPARLVRTAHSVHYDSPEGPLAIDSENNHCLLTPRIGVCREDGQFDVVWQGAEPVRPDPYLSTFGLAEFWLK
jgi:branched-chain amino acid transport system substrate-binding protein